MGALECSQFICLGAKPTTDMSSDSWDNDTSQYMRFHRILNESTGPAFRASHFYADFGILSFFL
jgi:hypothetical protein